MLYLTGQKYLSILVFFDTRLENEQKQKQPLYDLIVNVGLTRSYNRNNMLAPNEVDHHNQDPRHSFGFEKQGHEAHLFAVSRLTLMQFAFSQIETFRGHGLQRENL